MFALLWVVLLVVRRNNADEVVSSTEITAEAGLCVVIPCDLTSGPDIDLERAVWYKCDQNCTDSDTILRLNDRNSKTRSDVRGRVSLLDPDLSRRNCSIIIKDLEKSDSGSYQLRFVNQTTNEFISCGVKLTVKDLTLKPTVKIPPLIEGQQATLTCTAPGFCPESVPNITWIWRRSEKTVLNSTLTFNSSVSHHGMEVTCKVSFRHGVTTAKTEVLEVTYVKKPKITGETALGTGDTLSLTCSVDSFPPSNVSWTKPLSSENLMESKGSATLVLTAVKPENAGVYTCTAKHLHINLQEEVNVTVGPYPKILSSSGCRNHSEYLICTCIGKGIPLPTIKWPLLEDHTEFSVTTTTSNRTINSTFILAVKNPSYTAVECVSSNKLGDVKQYLVIKEAEEEEEEGPHMKLFRLITRLEMIIAFLIGALLSAILCCLGIKCHRKKQRTYGNLAEALNLEMVTSQGDPLINPGQAEGNGQAIYQEAAEGAGDVAAGKPDVDYSNLDFSRIQRKSVPVAETTETEYAEIKKENARRNRDGKEEEEIMEKDGENREGEPDDKEGEDVYSNVEDIMGQSEDSVAKVFQETAAL